MIDIKDIALIAAHHTAKVTRAMAKCGLIEDNIDANLITSRMITECIINIIHDYNVACMKEK